ncbi:AaceriAAR172Wp [[Ashbya] aceris (nom. inval.)]|nr:AaceriAAR172Wp [[Ashbya] aceris (nom. inval.)]
MDDELGPAEVPAFYCCYLLRSIPKRLSYYIGSTPNPVRRLRQHNGLLTKGGAYRTKRQGTRPWELAASVSGFPSKIAALQFEHAWQHPYQTRFIKSEDRIVKKKGGGRSIHQRLAVLKLLLHHPFFKVMSLVVHLFSEDIQRVWFLDKYKLEAPFIHVEVDEDALCEPAGNDEESIIDHAMKNLKLVELFYGSCLKEDAESLKEYRRRLESGAMRCAICDKIVDYVDYSNSTSHDKELVAFCCNRVCDFFSCLSCLYNVFASDEELRTGEVPLIPTTGQCPNCNIELTWARVVRHSMRLFA